MALYVVNMNFDGGQAGEIIEADPSLIQDWIDAKFVSEVDERGDRIVRGDTVGGGPGVTPSRTVSAEDSPAPES